MDLRSGTKQSVVEAVCKVFSRHGYDCANADAIATTAGVMKVKVYWRLDSKNALIAAAHQRFIDELPIPR